MDGDPLAALRPAHWPEALPVTTMADLLSAALAGGLAALLLVSALLLLRRRAKPSPRSETLASLSAARTLPAGERLAAQAAALRRHVLRVAGPADARLEGEAWLGALDRVFRTDRFSGGEGRVLVDGLYRPVEPETADALDRFLDRIVRAGR